MKDLTFQIVILCTTSETQDEVMRVTLDNPLVRAKGFTNCLVEIYRWCPTFHGIGLNSQSLHAITQQVPHHRNVQKNTSDQVQDLCGFNAVLERVKEQQQGILERILG